jgi:hypothetical protein
MEVLQAGMLARGFRRSGKANSAFGSLVLRIALEKKGKKPVK